MRKLLVVFGFAVAAPALALASAPVTSGAYNDAMLIAYNPATGQVSGYFDMTQDGPPAFACIFYLHGKLAGTSAAIATDFPAAPKEVIKGKLTLSDPKHFTILLKPDPGGCGNLEPFDDPSMPASFDLASAHPWTQIVVVKSAKAYFYDAPGAAAHRKAYVVQGDGLGVRASRPGWVQVDYTGGDTPVSGWVKTTDLYPTP